MILVVHPGSRIPDPDPGFLPIPDPGVKKAPDPGSESATLLAHYITVSIRASQIRIDKWKYWNEKKY
jgi:hypothetical protein